MTSEVPEERPEADKLVCHPLFWDHTTFANYFTVSYFFIVFYNFLQLDNNYIL